MYVGTWAERTPDKAAVIFDDGHHVLTYADLDAASNQVAHYLRHQLGLAPGDGVAVLLENRPEFAWVWWAAMRSGLYITPINWHLTPSEIDYVLHDSGARVVFYSSELVEVVDRAVTDADGLQAVAVGSAGRAGDPVLADAIRDRPTAALAGETAGTSMFYSSGTTGRPKGIRTPLTGRHPAEDVGLGLSVLRTYGLTSDDRYLSTAPLYHSSPSIWSFGMTALGGTAVIMSSFEPEAALRLIDHQRITVSQWVPTMFGRLLKLGDDVRSRYDLSTHRTAFHAAAPCPIEVKRRMIEWWGPILEEFYAGTEGGSTHITSKEWLERPGSVGRHWTGGPISILDPVSHEVLGPREEGLIYFEAMSNHRFTYHNDPDKTAATYHGGLVTLGDIGYLDEDGYLFLTDRQGNMIIVGGVNIYPREIEDVLVEDPRVDDVAVIGVPDDDMGEAVKAVVQLAEGVEPSTALADELIAQCQGRLAKIKCPRSIDFVDELPRDANGKLYKRRLRDGYWKGRASRLV
jgi:long-chain acyl-CoA synthetase